MTRLRPLAAFFGVILVAATSRGPIGFVDLPRLVANDPLHSVLLSYDREIAALQSTQKVSGLTDVGAHARRAANAARREATAAQARVRRIGARDAQADRTRERTALAAVLASAQSGDREVARYAGELQRETDANEANYTSALAQRSDRAYAARAQQLREKESTLAFDLARKNGGTRLSVRLKLADPYLSEATKAVLHAKLAALDAQERSAVAALQARDAAILAAYRRQLQTDADRKNAAMAARLRQAAGANFAVRERVRSSAMQSTGSRSFAQASASFGSTYRVGADADGVVTGFRNAGDDLSRRFVRLGEAATASQHETADQLKALTATRRALYQSIVARIQREAELVARRRGLAKIEYGSARPGGSVDLTQAVQGALAR